MYKLLITALILASATVAGLFGATIENKINPPISLGSFNPTGGGTYRLKTSIGTTNTQISLSSFKEPISGIPYTMSYLQSDIGYGTLDPQNTSRKEFVSFTGITQNADGSATLTGVNRGLTFTPDVVSGCTASTTLRQAHPGQSIFILSDSPCLFREYLTLRTTATSSAVLFYSSTTPPRYDSTAAQKSGTYIATTSELASIDYVNAVAIAGSANATEAVKGISEFATARETASSTILGGTGAGLVMQAQYATDTPQRGCATGFSATAGAGCTVIAQLTGKIKQAWLNLAELWTFTSGITSTATTTIAASNVNSNAFVINTLGYSFPSTRAASSTVLTEDGTGALRWITPSVYVLTAGTGITSASNSTTSLATIKIPASTLTTTGTNYIAITANYNQIGASQCYTDIGVGTGTATTTFFYVPYSGAGSGGGGTVEMLDMKLFATSTSGVGASATISYGINSATNPYGNVVSSAKAMGGVANGSVIYVSIGSRSPSSTSCGVDFYSAEVHNF